jgi:hypothetical protein
MHTSKAVLHNQPGVTGFKEVDQSQTVVSTETLNRIIFDNSVSRGGTKRGFNSSIYTSGLSPTNVIEMPGNTINMDVGYFGQPNPFANYSLARFGIDQIQLPSAFPPPTYYHTVVGNNFAEPLMAPMFNLQPARHGASMKHDEFKGFDAHKDMHSAASFTYAQNPVSANMFEECCE